ncbi:MAG: ATP-binding cassette domain-containing protein [Bdellovibrionales bacterium]|nr:ATP-binding cassette domain-containing protein [Bdellovibrionales bacterium]
MKEHSSPILSAHEVSFQVNATRIVDNVSFSLGHEEVLGLIGPSGSGKSVLLKILSQVYEPTSGSVECAVNDHHELSLMFQEGALFDSLSVLDNVAFPLVDGRVPCSSLPWAQRQRVCDKAYAILDRVGLKKHAAKVPGQLSGGMRRRVSLARALVSEPKVALLDDPTAGLDPVASSVIMELIRSLHDTYHTSLILVSHDLRRLLPVSDRVLALFDGRIIFDGQVEDIASHAPEVLRRFVACRYDVNHANGVSSGDSSGSGQ